MTAEPRLVPLMAFLRDADSMYYGKVLELHESVQQWLAYIPQTFAHYTDHTIRHSDEVLSQISKLLFPRERPASPTVALSPTEAYILAACAYLHDAGMVVSDAEKAQILGSDAWHQWVSDGPRAKRWSEIEEMRRTVQPEVDLPRDFLADVQIRFLVAEFVRRTHHARAADVIAQHEPVLGRFAFDNPMLRRTISDVCVSHGLKPHELDDRQRYPEARDIRGDTVDVQFMAILLRLGDLLDMSSDRACPLLLNAACPLPADSYAHWTKYQRITHRLTSPDKIEVTAECENQDEHRFLQDWCQWLVDEARESATLMGHAGRRSRWAPPKTALGDTIYIRPAQGARYIPGSWRSELDADAVPRRAAGRALANATRTRPDQLCSEGGQMSDPVYTLKMKQDAAITLDFEETAGHRADKLADLCTKGADGSIHTKHLAKTSDGKLTATAGTPIPFGEQPYLYVCGNVYPLQNTPPDYRLQCAFQAPADCVLLGTDKKEIPAKKITLSGKLSDITLVALRINIVKV